MNKIIVTLLFVIVVLSIINGISIMQGIGFIINKQTQTNYQSSHGSRYEVCGDGLDNDRDGYIDCIDWDCACSGYCAENCYDGIDNDRDGYIDRKDWYCDPQRC